MPYPLMITLTRIVEALGLLGFFAVVLGFWVVTP